MEKRQAYAHGAGYQLTSIVVNKLFNMAVAAVLLIVCLPLIALLYLTVLLCDGLPVFYRGVRLGYKKRPFTMYKFRTLVPDAEEIIGSKVFTVEQDLMTPFGKFFRDTRLDELPQLWNVIRGDMDFVGPRPVRPAIYESICKHIRNYDRRFDVSPGLIGYAQLFTPHSSPKRIRTLIDNALVRRKKRMLWDLGIVAYAMGVVLCAVITKGGRIVYRNFILARVLRRYKEKRKFERIEPRKARVFLLGRDGEEAVSVEGGALVDINQKALLMRTAHRVSEDALQRLALEVELNRPLSARVKRKRAVCRGSLFRESEREGGTFDYVIEYEPVSPLNFYMVHQYFLAESLGATV